MPSVLQKSVALPECMTDCRPTPLYDTKMQITVPPPSHLEFLCMFACFCQKLLNLTDFPCM